jgi:CheY-like chemotaxis protein
VNSKHYRSRHRVLLVEDHEPLAEATAEFIREKGLEVRIAANGREALELASIFKPEIVLCDMRLPDMPGFEVAQELRTMPGAKDAVIAMHTAMNDTDLQILGQGANTAVDLFLSKPITAEKLDTLIAKLYSQPPQKKP